MIIDYLAYNYTNIFLSTILINIVYLNDKKIYFILGLDLLFNGIPFVTILIIILYYLNNYLLMIFNNNFLTKYILLCLYYFLYGISLYSIFNHYNSSVLNILLNNLVYNYIYFYIGLKYYESKYN